VNDMRATTRHHSLMLRAVGVSGALTLAALAVVGPASSAAVPATPQLSIAVDDGQTAASVGDTLDYTVTVRNLGTAGVKDLVVSQSMPTGLQFTSATSHGVAQKGAISWRVNVLAAGHATLHATMTVSATPADTLRLATVACASTSAKARPIVCASHSDQLPAGKAAAAHSAAKPAAPSSANHAWWYVGGGAGLIVLALGGFTIRRRAGHRTVQVG
jgi:uncharacterized repeat protein (TIGR01451 family)